MSEQIRREFTLPFPMAVVSKAVENACATNTTKYMMANKNETFNTFTVNILKGIYVLPTSISLRPATDTTTVFELSATPGRNLSQMPGTATAAVDGFLQVVGDFASGKLIIKVPTAEDVAAQVSQGKKVLWFMALGILFIIFVIYFYLKG